MEEITSSTATATAQAPLETVPQHHRVLIAAAVAAVCGDGARVLGIAPVERVQRWARQGRMAIHASHSLPGRDGIARQMPNFNSGEPRK